MVTVDLSAHRLVSRIRSPVEGVHLALGNPDRLASYSTNLPFRYLPLQENLESLLACDAIVFWGDFLHAMSYWRVDLMPRLPREGIASSQQEIFDVLHRHLMLEGAADKALQKSIIFGGTLISNTAKDYLDERYRTNLTKLFSAAQAVLLRDAISAASIAPLRSPVSTLGMDCAFLLRDEDLDHLSSFVATAPELRDGVGVFFGRSPKLRYLLKFSRNVARSLGLQAQWIPWLPVGRRRSPLIRLYGYDPGIATSPGEVLARLSKCKFVVTDTYHLCVNAWRLGIPAVCIGQGANHITTTIGDKKKEILYSMYGAEPYYVFLEQLNGIGNFRRTCAETAEVLKCEAIAENVRRSIASHQSGSEEKLLAALGELL